jgi:hypothetical protein
VGAVHSINRANLPVRRRPRYVRFLPDSDHIADAPTRRKSATTGLMRRSKLRSYSITSSAVASTVVGILSPQAQCCVKIDNEFELRRLLDRQVCGLGALEDRHTKI